MGLVGQVFNTKQNIGISLCYIGLSFSICALLLPTLWISLFIFLDGVVYGFLSYKFFINNSACILKLFTFLFCGLMLGPGNIVATIFPPPEVGAVIYPPITFVGLLFLTYASAELLIFIFVVIPRMA